MKKFKNSFFAWVALLGAGFALVACSDNTLDVIEEASQQEQAYFFSVKASKGGDVVTKALTEEPNGSGKKQLVATWATTENVYVKHGDDWATGSLNPDQNGAEATLKGSLSGTGFNEGDIAVGDNLTLQFPKSGEISYAGQKGTLDDIAANFDYAVATATVTAVDGANVTTTSADFVNQQAIVKFELYDHNAKGTSDPKTTDNDVSISATGLTIVVSDFYSTGVPLTLTVDPEGDDALSVFYVAIPEFTDKAISLTATVGTGTYSYAPASNVSFENGKYYKIKVYPSLPTPTVTTAPSFVDPLAYTGSAQDLINGGTADHGTFQYFVSTSETPAPVIGDGNWASDIPQVTDINTYYVWYYVEGGSDYYDTDVTLLGSKTMAKAASAVTTAPAAVARTYDKTEQVLISQGVATGGDLYYYVSDTEGAPATSATGWTTDYTKITGMLAGNYYVYYYVKGDANHYDTAVTAVSNTKIAQRTVTFDGLVAKNREYKNDDNDSADVAADGFIYTGVTIPETCAGDDLSLTATGAFAALTIGQKAVTGKVTLTGADAANYVLSDDNFTVQAYIIPFLNLDASTHTGYYVCTDLSYYPYNAVPASKTVRGVIAFISRSGDGINGEIANPVEPGHGLIIDMTDATTATSYDNAVSQLATYNDANKFNGKLFKTATTSFEDVGNWRIPTDDECDTQYMAIYGSSVYSILGNGNGVSPLSTSDNFWTSSTYQQGNNVYHIYFHYSDSNGIFKNKNDADASTHSNNVSAKVRAVVSF